MPKGSAWEGRKKGRRGDQLLSSQRKGLNNSQGGPLWKGGVHDQSGFSMRGALSVRVFLLYFPEISLKIV